MSKLKNINAVIKETGECWKEKALDLECQLYQAKQNETALLEALEWWLNYGKHPSPGVDEGKKHQHQALIAKIKEQGT